MDSKYKESLYAVPHYPQTLKLCSQRQNSSVISEDQKVTTRLATACAKDCDSTESEDLSSTVHDSALMADNYVSEIELDSLRKADQILIETARSIYVFTIKDPKALSGRLIGGLLGNRLVEAHLLASRAGQKRLKAGEKFTFIMDAAMGPKRLTTSTVKVLVHRKKSGATRPLNRKRRVTLEQVSD
ncbi:MAG TPA: hypothetical protein VF131_13270 [Blastocatellia bacterium]|nr:hypothetical protein [Blastocatellia bacterium]